jgi:RNase H-fold protein (predicted Holliday junction resolvase)
VEVMFCFEDESWTTKEAKYKIYSIKKAVQYHGHIHGEKELEDGIAAMKIL